MSENGAPVPGPDGRPESYSKRFAKNVGWMASSQIGGKIAGFIFVMIIARGLGPTEYGYFNFAASFVPLFLMFGTWGLEAAVIGEIARDRERMPTLFMSGFAVRLGLGFVALLVSFATAPLLIEGGEAYIALALVGGALFLDELSSYVGTVFKAFEQMRFYAQAIFVNRVASTGLAFVALLLGGELAVLSATYLLGSFGALAFAWVALKRNFPPVRFQDADRGTSTQLLRQGVPLGVAAVLNIALFRVDAVMLQAIKGPFSVGMYGIAYRFLDSFLFVAWSMSSAAFPRMARSGASKDTAQTYQMAMALLLSFYIPIAVGAPFAAEWVIEVVFGSTYEPAARAVPWLTAAGVFYAIAYISRIASIGVGRRWTLVWVAGVALVANVIANAIVIPEHGFVGAAAVTCGSEVLEATLITFSFWRAGGRFRLSPVLLVPVLAGGAMAASLMLTRVEDLAAILLGTAVYLVSLWIAARLFAPAAAEKARAVLRRRTGRA